MCWTCGLHTQVERDALGKRPSLAGEDRPQVASREGPGTLEKQAARLIIRRSLVVLRAASARSQS